MCLLDEPQHLAVGGVVGLVATGLLVGDGGDYRRLFWIGLGVTLLSLALAACHLVGARYDMLAKEVLDSGCIFVGDPSKECDLDASPSPRATGSASGPTATPTDSTP